MLLFRPFVSFVVVVVGLLLETTTVIAISKLPLDGVVGGGGGGGDGSSFSNNNPANNRGSLIGSKIGLELEDIFGRWVTNEDSSDIPKYFLSYIPLWKKMLVVIEDTGNPDHFLLYVTPSAIVLSSDWSSPPPERDDLKSKINNKIGLELGKLSAWATFHKENPQRLLDALDLAAQSISNTPSDVLQLKLRKFLINDFKKKGSLLELKHLLEDYDPWEFESMRRDGVDVEIILMLLEFAYDQLQKRTNKEPSFFDGTPEDKERYAKYLEAQHGILQFVKDVIVTDQNIMKTLTDTVRDGASFYNNMKKLGTMLDEAVERANATSSSSASNNSSNDDGDDNSQ